MLAKAFPADMQEGTIFLLAFDVRVTVPEADLETIRRCLRHLGPLALGFGSRLALALSLAFALRLGLGRSDCMIFPSLGPPGALGP